jgi:hypothetical protein
VSPPTESSTHHSPGTRPRWCGLPGRRLQQGPHRGWTGGDDLTGGSGADEFAHTALGQSQTGAIDIIRDFSHADGDQIDLSNIDAKARTLGEQGFRFNGTGLFHGEGVVGLKIGADDCSLVRRETGKE